MKTFNDVNSQLLTHNVRLDSFIAGNPKMDKSAVATYGLSLNPSYSDKICAFKNLCADLCLYSSGMQFNTKYKARTAKSALLFEDRNLFMFALVVSIARKQKKHNGAINIRPNVISDIPYWHGTYKFMPTMEQSDFLKEKFDLDLSPSGSYSIFEIFGSITFYDYTKNFHSLVESKSIDNYHLTFSLDGHTNKSEAIAALKHGFNVAVPALIDRPDFFAIDGRYYPTYDADKSDDRTADPAGGHIGWLKYKRVKGNPANNGFLMTKAGV
ncbi:MAG: hypothetical protein OEU86_06250 [Gammaproteobacteria bacterium]|nr:hypothetical protein [Gammaproteobacteria bacterium]